MTGAGVETTPCCSDAPHDPAAKCLPDGGRETTGDDDALAAEFFASPAGRPASKDAGREWSPRSALDWAVLDEVRRHSYVTSVRGPSHPDDPGWHACLCGWEGYWCDYQPHVAERIVAALPVSPPAREAT